MSELLGAAQVLQFANRNCSTNTSILRCTSSTHMGLLILPDFTLPYLTLPFTMSGQLATESPCAPSPCYPFVILPRSTCRPMSSGREPNPDHDLANPPLGLKHVLSVMYLTSLCVCSPHPSCATARSQCTPPLGLVHALSLARTPAHRPDGLARQEEKRYDVTSRPAGLMVSRGGPTAVLGIS